MNATSTKLLAPVTGNASLIRPQFSQGQLLQDDDLNQVVDYVRDMTRLLFRTMLGCGVMCGFKVKQPQDAIDPECYRKLRIEIGKGVALDCRGDLIELPGNQTVEIDLPCDTQIPTDVWVVIRRRETHCAPRDVMCSPQDGDVSPVKTRICDGYEIQVLDSHPTGCCPKYPSNAGTKSAVGDCCDIIASADDPCYHDHYQGVCACECICDCVVLAKVNVTSNDEHNLIAKADYSVRRFVRPVLMRDPLVPYAPDVANEPVPPESPAKSAPTPPAPTPKAPKSR